MATTQNLIIQVINGQTFIETIPEIRG